MHLALVIPVKAGIQKQYPVEKSLDSRVAAHHPSAMRYSAPRVFSGSRFARKGVRGNDTG